MRSSKSSAGLAILAGGLSFVGTARGVDLIQNGSFESVVGGTPKANGARQDGTESGWTGIVSSYNYANPYYIGPAIPASENPGTFYSWRHQSAVGAYSLFSTPTSSLSYVTNYSLKQSVSLTNGVTGAAIDAGKGQFTFSAWLSSYGTPQQNPEQPYLDLKFFDATGTNQLGPDIIFDRTSTNLWIGNAGTSAIIFPPAALTNLPAAGNHHWAKYIRTSIIPQTARFATVFMTRSPNAFLSGSPDTYVDLVKLDAISVATQTPVVESAFPAAGASGIPVNARIVVTLRDGTTAVNTNFVQLSLDGVTVQPSIQKAGPLTTVQYSPRPALAGNATHTYQIIFSDDGTPTIKTNQFQFTTAALAAAIFPPDHIVLTMLENRAYSEIIGNTNDAPFLNSLLPFAANFTDSHAEQHPTDPNYLYLFAGDNQGIVDNRIPTNLPFTTPNLAAELLAAGFTYVNYAEDLPFTGDTTPVVNGPHGTYYIEENVAGYWISTNVPAPTNTLPPIVLQPLTNMPSDYSQLPTVAFVHPVEENTMHEGYWPNSSITISNGDFWMKKTLQSYVKWALTNNSLFIFTYDESSSLSPDNQIPTLFVGPMIKPGNYTNTINHFNVLRTLEDIFHLPYAGASAAAAPITGIWLAPSLKTAATNGHVEVTWPGRAVLQSSGNVSGPYNDVAGATSPYMPPGTTNVFYRLRSP